MEKVCDELMTGGLPGNVCIDAKSQLSSRLQTVNSQLCIPQAAAAPEVQVGAQQTTPYSAPLRGKLVILPLPVKLDGAVCLCVCYSEMLLCFEQALMEPTCADVDMLDDYALESGGGRIVTERTTRCDAHCITGCSPVHPYSLKVAFQILW